MTNFMLILKRLKDKQNLFLYTILGLLFTVIFISLTMITFVFDFKKDTVDKNPSARTLWVESPDEDKIKYDLISKIDHVDFNVSSKYLNSIISKVPEFDSEDLKGKIEILPLIQSNDLQIISGRNIENNLEAICPSKFYPHDMVIVSEDNESFQTKLINSKILNGNSLIGQSFTISNYDVREDKIKTIEVKIVGTYDTSKTMGTLNTCYITMNDFDKIATSYSSYGEYVDINGTVGRDYFEYEGQIVRVDNYKNMEYVRQQLEASGFSVLPVYQFDEEYLSLIMYIPLFVSIIALIVATGIIYNFLIKKIKIRQNSYGLLCSLGYEKKDIIQMEISENIIISFLAALTAIVIYAVLYYVICKFALIEFTYNSVTVRIPVLYFLIIFLILNLFIILMNHKFLKRILNNNINDLLKEA